MHTPHPKNRECNTLRAPYFHLQSSWLHNIDFPAYVTLLLLMPDMGSPLPISMGCACNYLSLWSSHEDYPINQCHFNLAVVLYVL